MAVGLEPGLENVALEPCAVFESPALAACCELVELEIFAF